MSERSTFVSDTLAYFADDREAVAAELMTHLSGFSPVLVKSDRDDAAYAVAGIARSSWAGGEWEDFQRLPPFAHNVSILINCDGGNVIRFNLHTQEWVNV